MISNICKINSGTADLAPIMAECEKVAVYNELTHKQSLQLRLICEEIDGMLPNIIGDFKGELWIEVLDKVCRVNVSLTLDEYTSDIKEELIGISKDKKNASAVGIVGKIRSALETFFLDARLQRAFDVSSSNLFGAGECPDCGDYAYRWSLDEYRSFAEQSCGSESWDELEKSVIASVADDVIVGVKGKHADIIITKNFK